MKKTIVLLSFALTLLFVAPVKELKAENYLLQNEIAASDSMNLMAEFSLFYEYYKNKDFKSALP